MQFLKWILFKMLKNIFICHLNWNDKMLPTYITQTSWHNKGLLELTIKQTIKVWLSTILNKTENCWCLICLEATAIYEMLRWITWLHFSQYGNCVTQLRSVLLKAKDFFNVLNRKVYHISEWLWGWKNYLMSFLHMEWTWISIPINGLIFLEFNINYKCRLTVELIRVSIGLVQTLSYRSCSPIQI